MFVFGICFSPFVLILILIKTLTSHQAFVSTYLRLWFLLVANLNPLLDPVVYCIRMKSVRKRMMKIFTKTENNNEEEEENHKTPWSSRCKRLQYIFKLTDIKWQMTWITDSYSRQETRLWFAFLIKFWPICLKFAWNRLLMFLFSKCYKKYVWPEKKSVWSTSFSSKNSNRRKNLPWDRTMILYNEDFFQERR